MSKGTLHAGWARTDITPPLGTRLRGYFSERLAEGVHDPLQAKALWLSDGDTTAAFVACDLICIDRLLTAAVAERLDLDPAGLVLHGTHTHLGPFSGEQVDFLAPRLAEAVKLAAAAAGPVEVAVGQGREEKVAYCRRWYLQDGSVRMNPGYQNPALVQPEGTPDPRVEVVRLTPAGGGAPLVMVNFALHLDTIGGKQISADYPYFLEQFLRRVHGPDLQVMFLQGCSGDINHCDFRRAAAEVPKGFANAERIGTILGAEVAKVLCDVEPVEATPLRVARQVLEFELEQPDPGALATAREYWAKFEAPSREELIQGRCMVRRADEGPVLAVEVTVLRFGAVGLAAFPGELFCEYQRQLRGQAPFETLLVAELCHRDIGYVPTRRGLANGDYEGWSSILPAGGGDRIIATALGLLQTIRS